MTYPLFRLNWYCTVDTTFCKEPCYPPSRPPHTHTGLHHACLPLQRKLRQGLYARFPWKPVSNLQIRQCSFQTLLENKSNSRLGRRQSPCSAAWLTSALSVSTERRQAHVFIRGHHLFPPCAGHNTEKTVPVNTPLWAAVR